MKKIVSCVLTALCVAALTSCLPDNPGTTYTSTFARIATIDHKVVPPRFYCDYSNEVFQFDNVQTNADLATFGLEDAPRALIYATFNAVDYEVDYTLNKGSEALHISAVCNKDIHSDDSFGPVYGFSRLEVERQWAYPYAWVSRGYLNIIPQIMSDEEGEHLLVPEGVSNDTLSFSLQSKYTKGSKLWADFMCYDLRTLSDTATADAGAKTVMKAMLDRLANRSDSVMVVVVADYKYDWPDTISKVIVPTDYFFMPVD